MLCRILVTGLVLFALLPLFPSLSSAVLPPDFAIDGNPREWSGGPLDPYSDVVPVQVDAIDIGTVRRMVGFYGPSKEEQIEVFAFLIRLGMEAGDIFAGPEERSLELFFDNQIDAGDRTTEWTISMGEAWDPVYGFAPDYRFRITWKESRIVEEAFENWTGSTWEGHSAVDIPEIEVATAGYWLEGAIRREYIPPQWFTLEGQEYKPGSYAVRTTQGESHDYFPDLGERSLLWGLDDVVQWVVVRELLWGRIKHEVDRLD